MSRNPIRGANLGFRILAVFLLVLGIAGGLTAGLLKTDRAATLTTADAEPAADVEQAADEQKALPRVDTDKPQAVPPGAKVLSIQRKQATLAAAQAKAKSRASEANRAAAARRAAADRAAASRSKDRAGPTTTTGGTTGKAVPTAPVDCQSYSGNRRVGCSLLGEFGFSTGQMSCLDKLWTRESQWTTTASNNSSGAYGIPQSLPGSKMASVADDWRTNPATQIRWGLQYIKGRYSTPCNAWQHSEDVGWY